jgi:PAS domain S-box-containing protein
MIKKDFTKLYTTKPKNSKDPKGVIEYFRRIIEVIPNNVYWLNRNCITMGCNRNVLELIGLERLEDFVGMTYEEMGKLANWTEGQAQSFKADDMEVMSSGKPKYNVEEPPLYDKHGNLIYYISSRVPLFDENGEVIGVVGISTDITDLKKLEAKNADLKVQNALKQKTLETQETFNKLASQVAHDIRSPLASLGMILKSCEDEIPEAKRIALREAATRIDDIANSLLTRFRVDKNKTETKQINEKGEGEETAHLGEALLLSTTLMQLLTDKKYEYPHVKWQLDIAPDAHFVFIKAKASDIKRALSNLINNAVDACSDRAAEISVKLSTQNQTAIIRVEDKGQGMPAEVLEKIQAAVSVTAGKEKGHGIGLSQVRETVEQYKGQIEFRSQLGQGTQVILSFPRVKSPDWLAEKILLMPEDTVVILDDDTSIHGAWVSQFEPILATCPSIQLKHFSQGQEALDFIQSCSEEQKDHLFLLTDYELLKQDLDGLTVIEKSQLKRSLLVTSHYAHPKVKERAAQIGCQILPKQMASEIQIEIKEAMTTENKGEKADRKVVIVDDDESFGHNLTLFLPEHLKVEVYQKPEVLLEQLFQYPKTTTFLLDHQIANSAYSGMTLAKTLHEKGYPNLHLLSGQTFEKHEVPEYLNVILKTHLDKVEQLFKKEELKPLYLSISDLI